MIPLLALGGKTKCQSVSPSGSNFHSKMKDRAKTYLELMKEERLEKAQAAERAQSAPVFSAKAGEIGWDWRLKCEEEEDEVQDGLLEAQQQSSKGSGRRLLEKRGKDEVAAAYFRAQAQMSDLLQSLVKESTGGTEGSLLGCPDELFRSQRNLQEKYLELRRSLWILEIVFEGSALGGLRRKMVLEVDPLVNEWYWHYKGKLEEIMASSQKERPVPPLKELVSSAPETIRTSPTSEGQSIGATQGIVSLASGEARPDGSCAASQNSTQTRGWFSTEESTGSQVSLETGQGVKTTHNKSPCVCCQGRHPLWQCHRFMGLSSSSRRVLVRRVAVCFVCLRSSHETSDCPQNPWNRCGILGCCGGHHYLLHPEVREVASSDWSSQPETETHSLVEGGSGSDNSPQKMLPESPSLAQELGQLSKRMTELEEGSKSRMALLEGENNDLRKELKEALESREELALELKGLKDRIGTLELALSEQQKTSAVVSQVGSFVPDPVNPQEETGEYTVCSAAEEDTTDEELLAELEAYEIEQKGNVTREEPRRQEAWWGDILEPLGEMPLKAEPVEILRDLIQFEEDLVLVPNDSNGIIDVEVPIETELSLLLEEFTNEKDWDCATKEVQGFPEGVLGEEEQHPSCAKLSTPERVDGLVGKAVSERNGPRFPTPCPTFGWDLITSDQNTRRVICRLAYGHRFINSCLGRFRPMSKELSTVEMDLARKHLDKLRGQRSSPWGESSVGWRADLLS